MTFLRMVKYGIAFGAPTFAAVSDAQSHGGLTGDGIKYGAASFLLNYVPYDITNPGTLQTGQLGVGYGSLFAAWVFGKVTSRLHL